MLGLGSAWDLISFMALLTFVLLLLPLVAGSSCIALSIFRLIIITRHKYEGDGADGSNANVLRALIFFYALVLAQGGFFILWLCILLYRLRLRDQVCSQYQFEDKDKKKLIDKYIDRTSSACIKTGVLNTINRNLVSFAVDLLQSEYSQDRISAALVLHTLTGKDVHKTHKAKALAKIQSSPDCIARIVALLTPTSSIDQETKGRLAQVVAQLGNDLRLADTHRAMESISSLIDPYLTKISMPANRVNNDQQSIIDIRNVQQGINQSRNTPSGEEIKPLIIHGLTILAKLAGNPDNCTEIYSTKGLFSKITAPISNKLYTVFSDNYTVIEITEISLQVVSKLVSGTDETNKKIRLEICNNGLQANSIHPILTYDHKYNKLKVPVIKIFTRLALDESTRNTIGAETLDNFISVLMGFFFDRNNEIDLRKTAGKALALLAMDSKTYCEMIMNDSTRIEPVVQRLSAMLSDASNTLYRTTIAQLLMQFCANLHPEEAREHLAPVKTILHEVLGVICNIKPEAGSNHSDSQQQNPSPGQANLHFFFPRIDTSSCTNGQNQDASQNLGENRHS